MSEPDTSWTQGDTLPLVLSLAADTSDNSYLGLTDSLAFTLSVLDRGREKYTLMLNRYDLSGNGWCDTLVFSTAEVDSLTWRYVGIGTISGGYGYEVKVFGGESGVKHFDHPGWITLPFPMGDTSNMISVGSLQTRHRDVSPEELTHYLRMSGECFYVVDIHDSLPRTVGCVQGQVLDVARPYLLLLTGYLGRPWETNTDYSQSRLDVVDMRDLSVAVSRPVSDSSYGRDIFSSAALTANHKLLYIDDNSILSNELHYFPQLGMLVNCRKIEDLLNLPLSVQDRMADSRLLRFCLVYSCPVLTVDIQSGDSTRSKLLVSRDGFWSYPNNALNSKGDMVYVSYTEEWEYTTNSYSCGSTWLPSISNLVDPPVELTGLRKLPGFPRGKNLLFDWELSPGRSWLVVNVKRILNPDDDCQQQTFDPVTSILVSASDLDYSRPGSRFSKAVSMPDQFPYTYPSNFLAGEDWLVVESPGYPSSLPRLCHISGRVIHDIFPPGEEKPYSNGAVEFIPSPEGSYVAYLCKLQDDQGFRFQVRRLPR